MNPELICRCLNVPLSRKVLEQTMPLIAAAYRLIFVETIQELILDCLSEYSLTSPYFLLNQTTQIPSSLLADVLTRWLSTVSYKSFDLHCIITRKTLLAFKKLLTVILSVGLFAETLFPLHLSLFKQNSQNHAAF